jgi:hypothetical protein
MAYQAVFNLLVEYKRLFSKITLPHCDSRALWVVVERNPEVKLDLLKTTYYLRVRAS